jgi:phage virion morphogenesis protein
MAGTALEYNLNDVKKLSQKLKAYQFTASQKRGLLKSLGKEIEEQTTERFDTKRDPDGTSWKAVSGTYRAYLEKHFPSAKPPLIREGDLQNSITSQLQDSDSVLVGATMEYAAYHQEGTKKIAARKFLGLNAENIADLADAVDTFMRDKLNE